MQPRRGPERLQGSGVAMHRNRLSRHRRADGYVNVQTQSVHKTCAILIPTKPQCGDREVGTASPAAEKLIELIVSGGGNISFLPRRNTSSVHHLLQQAQCSELLPTQIILHGFVVDLRDEIMCSRVDREGQGTGRKWRNGKNMIKMYELLKSK